MTVGRLAPLGLLVALFGCTGSGQFGQLPDDDDAVADDDDAVADDDDVVADDDDATLSETLTADLGLTRVTFNQGSQVSLIEGEQVVTGQPLVANRAGLLRVFVEPTADWQPREVVAVLEWDPGIDSLPVLVLEHARTPTGPSSDGVRSSTFEFLVPAEYVLGGAAWRVSITEPDPDRPTGGDDARWPRDGGYEGLPAPGGGTLDILLVPIAYNVDGSGRLPVTTPEQITILEDWLFRVYPTHTVNIEVDEPWTLTYAVSPGGQGWENVLLDVTSLRDERNVPPSTYIYGGLRPTDNAAEFCGGGCVAGLSWRADQPQDVQSRTSIGLLYGGEGAAGTMIHEVGHAHGRRHANCGPVQTPDPAYPHPDAELGVPGWDPFSDTLIGPTERSDMMGYCPPRWISDYTWDALEARVRWVNSNFAIEGETSTWRLVSVRASGRGSVRGTIRRQMPPSGEPVHAEWLDEAGKVVASVEGRMRPWEHIDGAAVLVPDAPADARALRLGGEVLPLPE